MALQIDGAAIAGRFQGFTIYQNENGFFWQEGGYYDDITEAQEDITDWYHQQVLDAPEDSPSLDEPWWAHR